MTAAQFWNWMSKASAELLEAGGKTVADEIEQRLRLVDARLGLEVSDPAEPRELIITAWSDPQAFAAVRELVAAAPKLSGWQIIALKPPRGFAFALDVDGLKVDASELQFEPLSAKENPKLLGIRIFVPGATDDDDERFARALPLIIENGIGEEAAAQIDHTDYVAGASEEDEPLSIGQLLAYVKWHRRKHGLD